VSGRIPFLLQREWLGSLATSTVAAGEAAYSLFIDANRELLVCGYENFPGMLGLPGGPGAGHGVRTVLVPTPVPAMAGIPVRQVVAGSRSTNLALSEAGRVYMWGDDASGRLPSDAEDRLVPTLIEELCDHRVRQVAVGSLHCATVTEEGAIFMWPTAQGEQEWLLMSEDEDVPRLGLLHGITTGNLWPPQGVTALGKERVGSVAVGSSITLVTTESGAVYSFGDGHLGCLGHGDKEDQIHPKRIEALQGVYVTTVAVHGALRSLTFTACGCVYRCGLCERSSNAERHLDLLP
jgi:alpha-tubulin suppressor-like RCC1 family protein